MLKIKIACILSCLLISFSAQAEITKDDVLKIVESFQNGVKSESVEQIYSNLSPDWIMTADYKKPGNHHTYDSYKEFLARAFPMISNFQYKNINIGNPEKIQDGYRALMTIREMYFFGSKYVKDTHDQTWYFKETSNGIKVSKIVIHNHE